MANFPFLPRLNNKERELNPVLIALESVIAEAISNRYVTEEVLIQKGIYESFQISEEDGKTQLRSKRNGVEMILRFAGVGRDGSKGLIPTYIHSGGNLTDIRHLVIQLKSDNAHVTMVSANQYSEGAGVDFIAAAANGLNSYKLRGDDRDNFEIDTFKDLLTHYGGISVD